MSSGERWGAAGSFLVKVPATTANLGPGFDTLGLALDLYNDVQVEPIGGTPWDGVAGRAERFPVEVLIGGEGAGGDERERLTQDERNLVVRAFLAGWSRWRPQEEVPAVRLRCRNRIPLSSGLGSSAAAVTAGLLAAAGLCCRLGSIDSSAPAGHQGVTLYRPAGWLAELLELATDFEGHPDNVAAALFGGLTVALRQGNGLAVGRVVPREPVWAALVVPRFCLGTALSRSILPEKVSRQDAVFNLGRVAWMLLAAAAGNWKEAGRAMEDRLHEPHRVALVPGLEEALQAAREAGAWGAALSGSGPSIVALTPDRARAEVVARAMAGAWQRAGVESRPLWLQAGVPGALDSLIR